MNCTKSVTLADDGVAVPTFNVQLPCHTPPDTHIPAIMAIIKYCLFARQHIPDTWESLTNRAVAEVKSVIRAIYARYYASKEDRHLFASVSEKDKKNAKRFDLSLVFRDDYLRNMSKMSRKLSSPHLPPSTQRSNTSPSPLSPLPLSRTMPSSSSPQMTFLRSNDNNGQSPVLQCQETSTHTTPNHNLANPVEKHSEMEVGSRQGRNASGDVVEVRSIREIPKMNRTRTHLTSTIASPSSSSSLHANATIPSSTTPQATILRTNTTSSSLQTTSSSTTSVRHTNSTSTSPTTAAHASSSFLAHTRRTHTPLHTPLLHSHVSSPLYSAQTPRMSSPLHTTQTPHTRGSTRVRTQTYTNTHTSSFRHLSPHAYQPPRSPHSPLPPLSPHSPSLLPPHHHHHQQSMVNATSPSSPLSFSSSDVSTPPTPSSLAPASPLGYPLSSSASMSPLGPLTPQTIHKHTQKYTQGRMHTRNRGTDEPLLRPRTHTQPQGHVQGLALAAKHSQRRLCGASDDLECVGVEVGDDDCIDDRHCDDDDVHGGGGHCVDSDASGAEEMDRFGLWSSEEEEEEAGEDCTCETDIFGLSEKQPIVDVIDVCSGSESEEHDLFDVWDVDSDDDKNNKHDDNNDNLDDKPSSAVPLLPQFRAITQQRGSMAVFSARAHLPLPNSQRTHLALPSSQHGGRSAHGNGGNGSSVSNDDDVNGPLPAPPRPPAPPSPLLASSLPLSSSALPPAGLPSAMVRLQAHSVYSASLSSSSSTSTSASTSASIATLPLTSSVHTASLPALATPAPSAAFTPPHSPSRAFSSSHLSDILSRVHVDSLHTLSPAFLRILPSSLSRTLRIINDLYLLMQEIENVLCAAAGAQHTCPLAISTSLSSTQPLASPSSTSSLFTAAHSSSPYPTPPSSSGYSSSSCLFPRPCRCTPGNTASISLLWGTATSSVQEAIIITLPSPHVDTPLNTTLIPDDMAVHAAHATHPVDELERGAKVEKVKNASERVSVCTCEADVITAALGEITQIERENIEEYMNQREKYLAQESLNPQSTTLQFPNHLSECNNIRNFRFLPNLPSLPSYIGAPVPGIPESRISGDVLAVDVVRTLARQAQDLFTNTPRHARLSVSMSFHTHTHTHTMITTTNNHAHMDINTDTTSSSSLTDCNHASSSLHLPPSTSTSTSTPISTPPSTCLSSFLPLHRPITVTRLLPSLIRFVLPFPQRVTETIISLPAQAEFLASFAIDTLVSTVKTLHLLIDNARMRELSPKVRMWVEKVEKVHRFTDASSLLSWALAKIQPAAHTNTHSHQHHQNRQAVQGQSTDATHAASSSTRTTKIPKKPTKTPIMTSTPNASSPMFTFTPLPRPFALSSSSLPVQLPLSFPCLSLLAVLRQYTLTLHAHIAAMHCLCEYLREDDDKERSRGRNKENEGDSWTTIDGYQGGGTGNVAKDDDIDQCDVNNRGCGDDDAPSTNVRNNTKKNSSLVSYSAPVSLPLPPLLTPSLLLRLATSFIHSHTDNTTRSPIINSTSPQEHYTQTYTSQNTHPLRMVKLAPQLASRVSIGKVLPGIRGVKSTRGVLPSSSFSSSSLSSLSASLAPSFLPSASNSTSSVCVMRSGSWAGQPERQKRGKGVFDGRRMAMMCMDNMDVGLSMDVERKPESGEEIERNAVMERKREGQSTVVEEEDKEDGNWEEERSDEYEDGLDVKVEQEGVALSDATYKALDNHDVATYVHNSRRVHEIISETHAIMSTGAYSFTVPHSSSRNDGNGNKNLIGGVRVGSMCVCEEARTDGKQHGKQNGMTRTPTMSILEKLTINKNQRKSGMMARKNTSTVNNVPFAKSHGNDDAKGLDGLNFKKRQGLMRDNDNSDENIDDDDLDMLILPTSTSTFTIKASANTSTAAAAATENTTSASVCYRKRPRSGSDDDDDGFDCDSANVDDDFVMEDRDGGGGEHGDVDDMEELDAGDLDTDNDEDDAYVHDVDSDRDDIDYMSNLVTSIKHTNRSISDDKHNSKRNNADAAILTACMNAAMAILMREHKKREDVISAIVEKYGKIRHSRTDTGNYQHYVYKKWISPLK